MSKNRLGRINDEMRAALSEALRGVKDPRVSGGLISIVRCEVTNDLRWCKVYVSVLGSEEQQRSAISGLKSAAGWLRCQAGQRVDLRYTPELVIVPDDSISHGVYISKILNDLGVSNTDGEDERGDDN